jgi:hypothetical protein
MDKDELIQQMVKELRMNYKNAYEEDVEWDDTDSLVERTTLPSNYNKMLTGVMEYLESVGGVEFAILKDPELGAWWAEKVKKREAARKKEAALEKLKSTMSKEELKILGISVK